MPHVFEKLGVTPLINAKGPATRLSGGFMAPEVTAAMTQAAGFTVDMAELQAAASRAIAAATGAEAGIVTSGAAAGLLLGTAACMTGLDPGAMARLPAAVGLRNEIVMVRSQRNFYDHAIRGAGATIIEVGLPDRYAGAGIRDAEGWEIADAITERTAAVFYVADAQARPALPEVVAVAHAAGVPVLVDAAAQLPPARNLRAFTEAGADLVAFSGGKIIGGPQATGILCGRRDLIMAAALQMLDLDVMPGHFEPPTALIDLSLLRGLPPHGIGRPCKVGKEGIVGLLTALQLFLAETDAARHAQWLERLIAIRQALPGLDTAITSETDSDVVPLLAIDVTSAKSRTASDIALALQRSKPPIYVDTSEAHRGRLLINPVCLKVSDAAALANGVIQAMRDGTF